MRPTSEGRGPRCYETQHPSGWAEGVLGGFLDSFEGFESFSGPFLGVFEAAQRLFSCRMGNLDLLSLSKPTLVFERHKACFLAGFSQSS